MTHDYLTILHDRPGRLEGAYLLNVVLSVGFGLWELSQLV